jgi:hypothetical protein
VTLTGLDEEDERMKFGRDKIEQQGVQQAREAWTAGSHAFVWQAPGQLRPDIGETYSQTLHAILEVGWTLNSTAAGGSGHVFFVFTRAPQGPEPT